MKRFFLLVLLAVLPLTAISALTDQSAKEARKLARKCASELARKGWRSLGDGDVSLQLESYWHLMYITDAECYPINYFTETVSEGKTIDEAEQYAISASRIKALDALLEVAVKSSSQNVVPTKEIINISNETILYIAQKEEFYVSALDDTLSCEIVVSDINFSEENATIKRKGYESMFPVLQHYESIPLRLWRKKGDVFEVKIYYIAPYKLLLEL